MTTITTAGPSGISAGDRISMTVPDKRWWLRAWCWLLRRAAPTRTRYFHVTDASATVLTIRPGVDIEGAWNAACEERFGKITENDF